MLRSPFPPSANPRPPGRCGCITAGTAVAHSPGRTRAGRRVFACSAPRCARRSSRDRGLRRLRGFGRVLATVLSRLLTRSRFATLPRAALLGGGSFLPGAGSVAPDPPPDPTGFLHAHPCRRPDFVKCSPRSGWRGSSGRPDGPNPHSDRSSERRFLRTRAFMGRGSTIHVDAVATGPSTFEHGQLRFGRGLEDGRDVSGQGSKPSRSNRPGSSELPGEAPSRW